MDLQSYEKKLRLLTQNLQEYDGNLADSDYKELQKMFELVFNSKVLDITDLYLQEQERYKLLLFKYLTTQSGTLSFLVIQILAAHNIMKKHDFGQKEFFTTKKCGIAINHLRAPVTIVNAKECENGYLLNGTLCWASGYKIFDSLLIGFHCKDKEYEAIAPFALQEGFKIGTAPKTFVGFGLHTVDIELKDYFVAKDDVVSSNPLGSYTKQKSASKTVHFCLAALAQHAISLADDEAFTTKATDTLQRMEQRFMNSFDPQELDALRVELFLTAQHIITTAMALKGGACVLATDSLQRLYKELIMFNANGLNNTLKELFKQSF